MKATVDIPDALSRQVKARAALQGRGVRDVTIELVERWLVEPGEMPAVDGIALADAWVQRWEALGLEIEARGVDPRSTVEIVLVDRR